MLDQHEQQNDNQISESSDKNGFWKNSPIYFDKLGMSDFVGKLISIVVGLGILIVVITMAIRYVVSVFE